MTEDQMVGWHHQLNGHECEQTQGDSKGQRSLVCCRPWGCKGADTTWQLNDNNDARWQSVQFSHSVAQFRLFATPWTAARPASLSITNSWSLLRLTSNELMMPSNHHILCHPLFLLPSIFPSIRVFSNESVLHIRWPKCWSFSFSISPSNEYSGLISFRMD